MRVLRFVVRSVILLIISFNVSAWSCYRHIYNHSSASWKFTASPQNGSIYFLGTSCSANGPCTISAGQTVELQYTESSLDISGLMHITDSNGKQHAFGYDNGDIIHKCPYIIHDDRPDTPPVSLNASASGDYSISPGGNDWSY